MRTHEALQAAIEALRSVILASETTSEDILTIERLRYQLREMQAKYPASR